MSEIIEVIPDPVSLIQSMRAVGYSVETAIADLLDNSLSAKATLISIFYDPYPEPFVAILDNGEGMTSAELTDAMRHGSKNPEDTRANDDLGRFGLGLKTASLSQCKKLTVISKKNNEINARCWDLDVVKAEKSWVVVVPSTADLAGLPVFDQLQAQQSGTLVIWQSLDRLMSGSIDQAAELTARMAYLHHHISFVFHRYTQKEDSNLPVSILINGLPTTQMDPFLRENTFRQPLEGQVIKVRDVAVNVKPFVLPPISHLTTDQIERAGGKEGLRRSQGFYIYRNRRLVIWGTWFRLVPKDEFFKLTRVMVDIPNSLDDLWSLDIKKSAAFPPDIIRNKLKDLIPRFASVSKLTLAYPGRKANKTTFDPVWSRIEPKHGSFKYELNTDHPALLEFAARLDPARQKDLQALLSIVSTSIPYQSIYADMCSDTVKKEDTEIVLELVDMAVNLRQVTGLDYSEIFKIDPIVRFPQYHEQIVQELEK